MSEGLIDRQSLICQEDQEEEEEKTTTERQPDDNHGELLEEKVVANQDGEQEFTNIQVPPSSLIDRTLFLNCFLESGRSFENLMNLYNSRSRKIHNQYIKKTINQVKHYYYNTWYKIANFVKEIITIDRLTLEILSMTNYAILCKLSIEENAGNVLNDLVMYGQVNFKYKGKNYSCRTPNCKALKNHLYSLISDGGKIPQNFDIYLLPYTNLSWNFIQSLALNPRLLFRTNNREKFQKIFDYILNMLKKFGPIQDDTFLTIFPSPETVVVDIPSEFEITSKVDFNLATFEKIIEHSKEVSKISNNFKSTENKVDHQSKRYTNVVWSYLKSQEISFFRLYRMLNMPKRFELFYDLDLPKINQYTPQGCILNSFSLNFGNMLIKKLIKLSEVRSNTFKAKKSLLDIHSPKIAPSNNFINQLKPIKYQYVKKMLFNGEKTELNNNSGDVGHINNNFVSHIMDASEQNNGEHAENIYIHNNNSDYISQNGNAILGNNTIVPIPESNELSQTSFASLFGTSEYQLPFKNKSEKDLYGHNSCNLLSNSHDSSSFMSLLVPGNTINTKQSNGGTKPNISFTNILSQSLYKQKTTNSEEEPGKETAHGDKFNMHGDDTHLLNLSLLADNSIDIYENFASLNQHIDRV
ncbi:MAG: chromatin binding [Marteilia pararefringens]